MNLKFWKVSNAQKSAPSAVLKIAGLEQTCKQGKAFPAASCSAPGPPGHPDWTHTSAGAHTLFLTLCAASFRFEIADKTATSS